MFVQLLQSMGKAGAANADRVISAGSSLSRISESAHFRFSNISAAAFPFFVPALVRPAFTAKARDSLLKSSDSFRFQNACWICHHAYKQFYELYINLLCNFESERLTGEMRSTTGQMFLLANKLICLTDGWQFVWHACQKIELIYVFICVDETKLSIK